MTVPADAMLPYRVPGTAAAAQTDTFAEGQVFDVSSAGMRFTVREWDGGRHIFGPAPWPRAQVEAVSHSHPDGAAVSHIHSETVPARGARVLVLFRGHGVENPWVVGVW